MSASRTAMLRSARTARARPLRQNCSRRFQSTSSQSAQDSTGGGAHTRAAVVGGIAGATGALTLGYAWYHFSGAKTAVSTVKQTKDYYESTINKVKENAPEPNEALDYLRKQATFYAGFVPGGKSVVDNTFKDIDLIREKHGADVDKIVSETYKELKQVTDKGLSVESASEAWQVLSKALGRIASLAGDASQQVIENHPMLKEKVGGNIDQLRSLADKLGPEAKQKFDQTWEEVQDILKGGLDASTLDRIRQLVQKKTSEVQKLGEKAWEQSLQEAKPFLDKNPQVKELLEKNRSSLLSGNITKLFQQLKQAATSGNAQGLESYIKEATQKIKDSSSSLEGYLDMLPGGSELLPKFEQFQELSIKHSKDAERLAKETIDEISQVLSKKLEEGKKLMDDASQKKK